MKEYESLTFEQMPSAVCRLLQEVNSIKNYLLNSSTLNDSPSFIIVPKNRTNGLVKKSFNFNTRYDKTNPTQILA